MKNFLPALASLSLLLGCSATDRIEKVENEVIELKKPVAVRGGWKDGKQGGRWTNWYANGQKAAEGAYKNGEKEGRWTVWWPNGSINSVFKGSGVYKAGKKVAPLPKN